LLESLMSTPRVQAAVDTDRLLHFLNVPTLPEEEREEPPPPPTPPPADSDKEDDPDNAEAERSETDGETPEDTAAQVAPKEAPQGLNLANAQEQAAITGRLVGALADRYAAPAGHQVQIIDHACPLCQFPYLEQYDDHGGLCVCPDCKCTIDPELE